MKRLLVVLVAAGTMPACFSWSAPPTAEPAATPRANAFCSGRTQASAGKEVLCEDFTSVANGQLPAGWVNGAGMMVQDNRDLPGTKVLRDFDVRRVYHVIVPWGTRGDFDLEMLFHFGCSNLMHGDWARRITIGGLELQIIDHYHTSTFKLLAASGTIDLPLGYHLLKVQRLGDVFTVTVDGSQVLIARYAVTKEMTPLTVGSRETVQGATRDEDTGFRLAGIRLETSAAAAAPVAPAAPPPPEPSQLYARLKQAVATKNLTEFKALFPPGEKIPVCDGEFSAETLSADIFDEELSWLDVAQGPTCSAWKDGLVQCEAAIDCPHAEPGTLTVAFSNRGAATYLKEVGYVCGE